MCKVRLFSIFCNILPPLIYFHNSVNAHCQVMSTSVNIVLWDSGFCGLSRQQTSTLMSPISTLMVGTRRYPKARYLIYLHVDLVLGFDVTLIVQPRKSMSPSGIALGRHEFTGWDKTSCLPPNCRRSFFVFLIVYKWSNMEVSCSLVIVTRF